MSPEAKEYFLDSMLEQLNDMGEGEKPPARDCPEPVYDARCSYCNPIPGRRPIPMPPKSVPSPRKILE